MISAYSYAVQFSKRKLKVDVIKLLTVNTV